MAAADAANSWNEVALSSSSNAMAQGVAAAARSSHSWSRAVSGSGKRHTPGEADAGRSEEQQLARTYAAGRAQVGVVDNQVAGEGVAVFRHGGGRQGAFPQTQHG